MVEHVRLADLTSAQRRKLLDGDAHLGRSKARGATAAMLPRDSGVPDWDGWELTFLIRGDPVPWARAGDGKHGRYTPTKQRNALKTVTALALYAMGGRKPLNGPVEIWLWFYRRNRTVADGSNLQKLVEDALTGVAWCDDRQVKDWHGHVRLDPANPRTVVRVRPGPEDALADWTVT